MVDDEFEWDDAKAERNWRAHAVSFAMARHVFKDAFAIEWADPGQDRSEDRFVILGMAEGRLLYVAFTLRANLTRIISARLAEPHERRKYHNANRI